MERKNGEQKKIVIVDGSRSRSAAASYCAVGEEAGGASIAVAVSVSDM